MTCPEVLQGLSSRKNFQLQTITIIFKNYFEGVSPFSSQRRNFALEELVIPEKPGRNPRINSTRQREKSGSISQLPGLGTRSNFRSIPGKWGWGGGGGMMVRIIRALLEVLIKVYFYSHYRFEKKKKKKKKTPHERQCFRKCFLVFPQRTLIAHFAEAKCVPRSQRKE